MELPKSDLAYKKHAKQIADARTIKNIQDSQHKLHSSKYLNANDTIYLETEFLVIGSGAGGATVAKELAKASKNVIIVEEGPLRTATQFTLKEAQAYPDQYQECAGRSTLDRSVQIYQGRCVGGGTTVNWTTSFKSPKTTLRVWRENYGLANQTEDLLEPYFKKAAEYAEISPWEIPPNANNNAIEIGAAKLGIKTSRIQRNVKGCANLGYCGLGCPIDAKQSTMVTSIPDALEASALLIHHLFVDHLVVEHGKAVAAVAYPVETNFEKHPQKIIITFKQVIMGAGAIGSPSILLRSDIEDPKQIIGKRTFLHPSAIVAGIYKTGIYAFSGAPQTVYSDQFLSENPEQDPIGFKIEAAPIYPVMVATILPHFGRPHALMLNRFDKSSVTIALIRDGFHEESQGGNVVLDSQGNAKIDYEVSGYVWDGVKRAYKTLAEIQFQAGAEKVLIAHIDCPGYITWAETKEKIETLKMQKHFARLASAHVMGGLPMGGPGYQNRAVDENGKLVLCDGVYVADASIFPTSLGTNPQWTIYANALRIAGEILNT